MANKDLEKLLIEYEQKRRRAQMKFEQKKEPKLHWYNCKTKEHLLDNNFNRNEMIEKGFVEICDDGNIN